MDDSVAGHLSNEALQRANYSLKLRVYHLEQRLQQRAASASGDEAASKAESELVELRVLVEEKNSEIENNKQLLAKARAAIHALRKDLGETRQRTGHLEAESSQLRHRLDSALQVGNASASQLDVHRQGIAAVLAEVSVLESQLGLPSPAAAAGADDGSRADAELAASAAPGASQRRQGIPGRLRALRAQWDHRLQLLSRLESERDAAVAASQRASTEAGAAREEAALLRGERQRLGATADADLRTATERLERLERHAKEQDEANRELQERLTREQEGRRAAEDVARRLEQLAGRAEDGAERQREAAAGASRSLEEARRAWETTERELREELARSERGAADLQHRLEGLRGRGAESEQAAEGLRERLRGAEEAWAEAASARGEAQADLETARSRARQAAADALAARQHARAVAGAAGEALKTARGALRRYRFHLREKLEGLLPRDAGDWAGRAGDRAAEEARRLAVARAGEAAGPGDPMGTGVRLGDLLAKRGAGGGREELGPGAEGSAYDLDADRVQPSYDAGMTGGLLLGRGGYRAGADAADGPEGAWAESPNVLVSVSELAQASAAIRGEEAEDEAWLDALAQVPTVRAWFRSQAESLAREAREELQRSRSQLARLEERLADSERRVGPAVEAARRDGVSSAGLKVRVAQLQERASSAEEKVRELTGRCQQQEDRAGSAESRARELDDRLDKTSRELREKQAALKAASRAHLSIAEAAENAQQDDEEGYGGGLSRYVGMGGSSVGGDGGRWAGTAGGGSTAYASGSESKQSDGRRAGDGARGRFGSFGSRVAQRWGEPDSSGAERGGMIGYGDGGGIAASGASSRLGERVRQQVRDAVDDRLMHSHSRGRAGDTFGSQYPQQRVQAVPPPSLYGTPAGAPRLGASAASMQSGAGLGRSALGYARTPVGAQLEQLAQSLEAAGSRVKRL